jgi:glycosyltransferase involved in cell wall biosynthesis
VKRKGFHTLIEAVSAVKNAHLWLLGDGEERENLERLAAELGVTDRLHFAGWQPDPRAHIAAADVFVMPSSHEPLGNVILEAWAMGKPVVSTKSEGPLWMMRDGEDGLLCDIGDVAGLAAALQRLSSDPGLREKLALGGANTLQTRFSQSAITEAYLALFKGSNSDQSRL